MRLFHTLRFNFLSIWTLITSSITCCFNQCHSRFIFLPSYAFWAENFLFSKIIMFFQSSSFTHFLKSHLLHFGDHNSVDGILVVILGLFNYTYIFACWTVNALRCECQRRTSFSQKWYLSFCALPTVIGGGRD